LESRSSCLSPNVYHVADPVRWRGQRAVIRAFETQPDQVVIRLDGWLADHRVLFSELERLDMPVTKPTASPDHFTCKCGY
jgi:hypothetical protein